MTTTTRTAPRVTPRRSSAVSDSLVVTWRYLKRIPRIPELAIFAILQSIMFVVIFAVVLGGAMTIPGGGSYTEFLMPGIFAQTIVFASAITAIGMVDDLTKGIIDRFRSLPMASGAVLTGRAISDVVYQGGIIIVLMLSGLVVGWTVRTGITEFLAGFALMLAFVFAMTWLGVWMGLYVPSVEVAQQVVYTVLFPLTFLSSAFVPPSTLPPILQPIAEWNPTSTLATGLRELWGNPNPYTSDSLASTEPVLVTIGWIVLFVAIFAPLSVRKYRSMSR